MATDLDVLYIQFVPGYAAGQVRRGANDVPLLTLDLLEELRAQLANEPDLTLDLARRAIDRDITMPELYQLLDDLLRHPDRVLRVIDAGGAGALPRSFWFEGMEPSSAPAFQVRPNSQQYEDCDWAGDGINVAGAVLKRVYDGGKAAFRRDESDSSRFMYTLKKDAKIGLFSDFGWTNAVRAQVRQAAPAHGGNDVSPPVRSAGLMWAKLRRLGVLRYFAAILCMAPGPCCHQDVLKPSYRTVTSTPPGIRWSGPVTLIADSQKFHIGNTPFLFRSGFTDEQFSASAVRAPQQDLFGDSLLTLAAIDSKAIVAHLGDAMDVSCVDEWREFSRIMAATGRPSWFWTPGNHDGYFFGNFVGPRGQWQAACSGSQRMTKDMVLRDYLQHLASYSQGTLDPGKTAWSCTTEGCRSLRRAAWHIQDGDAFYTSFVLQELDLPRSNGAPPTSLIMLDTSTYERPPRIAPSEPLFRYAAGEEGHLGPAQLRLVREWTRNAAAEGRIVVLAGHHPFNDLDEAAQAAIQELIVRRQAATYISAHTHWGQYFAHTGPDGFTWLEPNLGSIIDYDSEFGTLTVGAAGKSRFVRMSRTTIGSILLGRRSAEQGIACEDPSWLARPTDPDFYTNYKTTTSPVPRTVDKLYFRTMLAALERYWRCVPTQKAEIPLRDTCLASTAPCKPSSEIHDEVARALASDDLDTLRKTASSLLARDATRPVDACLRREYKVCQSMWAAEYEKRNYITPVRDEDTFEVNVARETVQP